MLPLNYGIKLSLFCVGPSDVSNNIISGDSFEKLSQNKEEKFT